MNGILWFLLGWIRAFDMQGRSRRREFGYFLLFTYLILFLGVVIVFLIVRDEEASGILIRIILGIWFVAIVFPRFTLTIRRLHDTGESGWLVLVALIPVVGLFVTAHCLFADSEPRTNEWGQNPKDDVLQPS
jgi:uncharacterized membrane protein YhaH (DUF805 family)